MRHCLSTIAEDFREEQRLSTDTTQLIQRQQTHTSVQTKCYWGISKVVMNSAITGQKPVTPIWTAQGWLHGFRGLFKLSYVGFWAYVKIASRIVSYTGEKENYSCQIYAKVCSAETSLKHNTVKAVRKTVTNCLAVSNAVQKMLNVSFTVRKEGMAHSTCGEMCGWDPTLSSPIMSTSEMSKKRQPILDSSVGFRSWSRLLAVNVQVTWVINPAVGCHYFPPGLQLPQQLLRGLLPISLLGEQRHDESSTLITRLDEWGAHDKLPYS